VARTLSPAESNPAVRKFRLVIALSWAIKAAAAVLAVYLLAYYLGAL
jgi:hypothetical protein